MLSQINTAKTKLCFGENARAKLAWCSFLKKGGTHLLESSVYRVHRFNPNVFRLGCYLAFVLYGALGVVLAQETVEQKRSYNLPRGDASTTLNQFAAASERHVIFMV